MLLTEKRFTRQYQKANFEPLTPVGVLTNRTLFHSSVSNSNRIYWNDSAWLPATVPPPNWRWGLMNPIGYECCWRRKDSRISTEKLNFEPPTLVGGLTNRTIFAIPVSNSNRIWRNVSGCLPVTVHPPTHVGGSWIRLVMVVVDKERILASEPESLISSHQR